MLSQEAFHQLFSRVPPKPERFCGGWGEGRVINIFLGSAWLLLKINRSESQKQRLGSLQSLPKSPGTRAQGAFVMGSHFVVFQRSWRIPGVSEVLEDV